MVIFGRYSAIGWTFLSRNMYTVCCRVDLYVKIYEFCTFTHVYHNLNFSYSKKISRRYPKPSPHHSEYAPPPKRWGLLAYTKLKNAAAYARINTKLGHHVANAPPNQIAFRVWKAVWKAVESHLLHAHRRTLNLHH